jgi:RNA polymerase sigma-70 factor (ECF subfamily)
MAEGQDAFTRLMEQIRAGSQDAARELVEQYGPHILRVVRRKLSQRLRTKFDSDDFVQAVWASFFAVGPSHYNFDRPEALIAFLVSLARNKVIDELRQRFQTEKHDINRERSLDGSAAFAAEAMPALQPTPSQIASAKEIWERLLDRVPPTHQRILALLQEGHTVQEVAVGLGVHPRTVYRLIQRAAPGYPINEESASLHGPGPTASEVRGEAPSVGDPA